MPFRACAHLNVPFIVLILCYNKKNAGKSTPGRRGTPWKAPGFYAILITIDQHTIVDTFARRAEEAHFSHLAGYEEIAGQEYNLSVSTYVEAEDTREKIDIMALNAEIAQIVAREQMLREEIEKIIGEIEGE